MGNPMYFSSKDLYPGMYVVPTVTERTIPDPEERAAYAENTSGQAGIEAAGKAIHIWGVIGGIILFLVVASIW